jgi:predicted dehydrogenase
MPQPDRRLFASSAVSAFVSGSALSASRVMGANEKIRLGFIGVGNRGDQNIDAFLPHKDIDFAAVCDLWMPYRDFSRDKLAKKGRLIEGILDTDDYRRVLDEKNVDAVVVSTPDHWHALQTIEGCSAGKDVYCEKPLSLTIGEGRAMVNAARKHKRIVQVGLQRRSSEFMREACQRVRDGEIGQVTVARAFHIQNEMPLGIGKPADENPPEGLDWDRWLGPAPKVPYNKNRSFYRFRWFFDQSGGQLTNQGVHYLNIIHWALGQDSPTAVTALGGKFAVEDNREIPDTMEVCWTYPGGTLVTFSQFNASSFPAGRSGAEVELRGTKGACFISSSGYEIVPDPMPFGEFPVANPLKRDAGKEWRSKKSTPVKPFTGKGKADTADHTRNFLDCIRSRKTPNADVEVGHRDTSAAILGNLAYQSQKLLLWDGKTETITNEPSLNKKHRYKYRAPHLFPE